jgi:SAM-dependent methyltransferase
MPIPVPPPPAPVPPVWSGRPGGPVAALDLHECQAFFGYLRIKAYADIADAGQYSDAELLGGTAVEVEVAGQVPAQRARVLSVQPSRVVEFEVDVLVDRGVAPSAVDILVRFGHGVSRFHLAAVLPYARARDLRTRLTDFNAALAAAAAGGGRPRVLDLGGRARSRVQKSEMYPHCDVTVFDIIAAPGVDVVGDAHALSAHFPPDSFDFAISLAVFEHLLMPWKAAVELSRVLKPGGLAYIWAPQSCPVHDTPWDFFRFSDNAWHALFNRRTGFEVLATDMSQSLHMVPRVLPEQEAFAERTFGFASSEALVRRIGPAEVDWPVNLSEVIDTRYPSHVSHEDVPHGPFHPEGS